VPFPPKIEKMRLLYLMIPDVIGMKFDIMHGAGGFCNGKMMEYILRGKKSVECHRALERLLL